MTQTAEIPTFNTAGLSVMGAPAPARAGATDLQLPERIDGFEYDPTVSIAVNKRRALRLLREGSAREVIDRLPAEGEELLLVMTGQYHGMDLLAALLDRAEVPAAEAYIATLGTNKANIDQLCDLLDAGKIERLTMLVSAMFTEKNRGEYQHLYEELSAEFAKRDHRLAVGRNHAKLILLKLADGRHIAAHGSLNLRRCSSFEQVAIIHDRGAYEFFARFVEDVIVGEVAV